MLLLKYQRFVSQKLQLYGKSGFSTDSVPAVFISGPCIYSNEEGSKHTKEMKERRNHRGGYSKVNMRDDWGAHLNQEL